MDAPTEYGGRALQQFEDYSFGANMTRYLKEKAEEIKLLRGRGKNPNADANDENFTRCVELQ
eukprot:3021571-Karenia_brevis.AAC.1